MRVKRFLLASVVLILLPVAARSAGKADDAAKVRKAIMEQNAKYAEAVTKQDLPAFLSLFTKGCNRCSDENLRRMRRSGSQFPARIP
jgi:hypothetical protein